jgi:L-rhamnose mutarotase
MQQVLLLDLKDDPALIEAYEAHHRAVWPEVLAHLRQHGVTAMRIFRLGTRLVMLLDTDDARHDRAAMVHAEETTPILQDWERLMWEFQASTPWTPAGQKWTLANEIFSFAA